MTTDRRPAFTLLEMLVAISLTGVVIIFITKMFADTSDAVRVGMQMGEVSANGNTVSQVLDSDFRRVGPLSNMAGPGQDGILIVVNHRIRVPVRQRAGEVTGDQYDPPWTIEQAERDLDDNEVVWRYVRDDQLLFIRRVGPGSLNELEPMVPAGPGTFAGNGTVEARFARIWYGHLRRTFPDGSDAPDLGWIDGDSSQRNRFANQWVLGRQVLFLDPGVGETTTHAKHAVWNALVTGGFAGDPLLRNAVGNPLQLYMGLADIAAVDLTNGGNPARQAIIDTTQGGSSLPLLRTGMHDDNYRSLAYQLLFTRQRLRVNPEMATSSRFESWRVAQMHPYLMGNVSDFIVEFAGDVDGDGRLDRDLNPDTNDPIIWYGRWPNPPGPVRYDSTWPIVRAPPLDYAAYDERTLWGQQLNTAEAGFDRGSGGAFVWRHDADTDESQPAWPHLLRIRYRLHDDKGELYDRDSGAPGVWFEQLVSVNRQ